MADFKQVRHLAVIMDGNGRWAKQRGLPRVAGHNAGVEALRRLVRATIKHHIAVLTVFAFSTENWKRSLEEVNHLFSNIFSRLLTSEVAKLQQHRIRTRIIGSHDRLSSDFINKIEQLEADTQQGDQLCLNIALNYGGQWDITEACRRVLGRVQRGELTAEQFTQADLQQEILLSDCPPPDLLIRTGGEQRISNFLLWQLAYAQLYFSPVYWPDFDEKELVAALDWYSHCDRRFGHNVN